MISGQGYASVSVYVIEDSMACVFNRIQSRFCGKIMEMANGSSTHDKARTQDR